MRTKLVIQQGQIKFVKELNDLLDQLEQSGNKIIDVKYAYDTEEGHQALIIYDERKI